MTPERYQQIKQIFLAALELPEGEAREGHVLRACAGDAELEREVRSLLEHHADVSDPDHPAPLSGDNRPTERSIPPSSAPSRGTHHSQATFSALDPHPVPSARGPQSPSPQAPAPPGPSPSRSSLRFDRGRFAPGSLIDGRYRIVDLIGRGGMGEVYRADDLKLGETVALKFLPRTLANNREWLDRFLEEVRVARNVSHPNVCRVYDVGEENAPLQVGGGGGGEHFITMEYVDGETLSSLTSRIGRLPPRKAEQLAQQLCAGLAAIHDLGILHRDLKPSNILIDDRGQLRVTDFGLAVPGEIKGFQAAAGTPGYVAPESLAGVEATVKSDIYQLGLLLYELFAGQPAYRSDGDKDLLKLQHTTEPPAPSTIAPDLKPQVEKVILQCLERDPALRPGTVRQVSRMLPGGDPLAAALEAGQTPSPSMVAMAGRKGRMRPASVLALVAVFIAFFVGAILLSKRAGLIQQAPLDRSGEALAERAREYLAQIGYPLKDTDHEAWGFDLYEELLSEIERTDKTAQRWDRLKRPRPTPVDFWYRRSPKHMGTQRPTGVVTMDDPPMNLPAMIQVRLTPRGYLREIAVIDKEAYWVTERKVSDTPIDPNYVGPPAPPVNFSPLFAAASLELAKFSAVQPERIPQVFADHRQAWIGYYPESPEVQIKVEAAGLNGRVVAFRIGEVALPYAQLVFRPVQERWKTISQYAGQIIFVSTVIASGVLAWRNLRSKRGDLIGAGRAAVFVAVATLVSFLLSAHTLSSTSATLGNLRWMVAASLAAGALVWVMYLGLEPHVRRIWPESIISWTRLVQGRWYDPLVGSSVLIGAGVGCFSLVMTYINRLIPGWLGLPPARPFVNETLGVSGLNGVRFAMGYVAQCSLQALQLGLMLMVACLIFKIVLRRTAPALIVFGALQSLVWVLGSPVLNTWNWTVFAVSWPIVGLVCASGLIVLVRYGLIAVIVAGFVFTVLSSSPLTFDGRAWYAGISAVSIGLVLALPIYGAAVAMLGRTRLE